MKRGRFMVKSTAEHKKSTKSFINFKKIGTKISLLITLLIIISSVTLLFMNVKHTARILEGNALEQLELFTESKSNEFDILLQRAESSLKSLNSLITTTFDYEQFKNDTNYVTSYDGVIAKVVEDNIRNNDVLSMYVVFNPDLMGFAHDVAYSVKNDSLVRHQCLKLSSLMLIL